MAEIKTPRGEVIVNTNTMKAEIVWNSKFGTEMSRSYGYGSPLQMYIDSDYLRDVEPYWPLLTGALIQSGILGTVIGSGLIRYVAPYARIQFYSGRSPGESQTGALRGREPHERWKSDNLTSFMASVQRFKGRM